MKLPFFARARRAIWTYRQPLTEVPKVAGAPISDLFLWRKGEGWETWFELTDMGAFYDAAGDAAAAMVCIHLFDAAGKLIAQHQVQAPRFRRTQVCVSSLAEQCKDLVGTFCVIHPNTPSAVSKLGSHLAERGYVSYCYRNAPLRAYVHGNLDAISRAADGSAELLGGAGVLLREYRLQHELLGPTTYEVGVVNPSISTQKIQCEVLQAADGRKVQTLAATLPPGGCHLFSITPGSVAKRLVIKSRLVMARPLIFRIEDQRMDVLHG